MGSAIMEVFSLDGAFSPKFSPPRAAKQQVGCNYVSEY